jgi:alkylation response protein AidB-like acyl-CoA dehydrogenase
VGLATQYAKERRLYGAPIGQLGAIADHLLRMRALELVVSALSVKAAVAANFAGPGASPQGALAKYLCGVLTEELVAEGRVLHGARSLLADHPYHRLSADAVLVSTFDGTTHVVLENIRWRLAQLAAVESPDVEALPTLRAMYGAAPQSQVIAARHARSLLLPPADCLRALAAQTGELPLEPLIELCQTMLALTRTLRDGGRWEHDQGTRLDAAALLAQIEGLCALVELADAPRREWLGLPPLPPVQGLRSVAAYAYGWLGGRIAAGLRALSARAGLEVPDSVAMAERVLLPLCAAARDRYLEQGARMASESETSPPADAAPMPAASPRLADAALPSVCVLSEVAP